MMSNAWSALFVLAIAAPAHLGAQQDSVYSERGPRFFVAASPAPLRIDVARTPALRRRITVDLENVKVADALDSIAQKGGLHIMYSRTVLPLDRRVRLRAQDITVAAALTEVLLGMDADVLFARSGQAAVVSRVAPLRAAVVAVGSITGRVTDAKSGAGVFSARVTVEGTNVAATTDERGLYRLVSVPAGRHQLTARRIGYRPRSVSVTVTEDSESTADIALEVATTMLNEVVVTGSIAPTEVKALPTPITVVNAEAIEAQHVQRFDEIIRLAVPGAMVWDQGANSSTVMEISVRGTNGLGAVAAKAPKVYIDGVEVTVRHLAPVDPQSIDHIEMIRGPQAAAIYGSDAIGGVIQIFTKRGTNGVNRPVVDAQASVGTIQSDFQGSGAVQQDYSASVRGVSGSASYRIGAGYSQTGDWIPEYSMAQPSLNGGVRVEQGPLSVDLSTRLFWQNMSQPFDPRLAATRYQPATFGYPTYVDNGTREETYSGQLGYRLTSWWQHALTLGVDRVALNYEQQRRRLSTPADTLLRVTVTNGQKFSLAYHTTATATLTSGLTASVTAGADQYVYTLDQFTTNGALSIVPLRLATGQILTATRDRVTNTGVFGQLQLNIREALFLTGAVRGEKNSGFGADLGMPVSPRVGATYVRAVGATTVKLRGSYGEAIRPPTLFQRNGSSSANSLIVPNPLLRPERQTGPDAGVDLVFGSHGSLGITYYNQTAKDLIQNTIIDATTTPRTSQYQNLAKVKNVGWEVEGTLAFTRASFRGQYAFTDSKPVDLGSYQGADYHVGENFIDLPRHTAGLMVSANPLRRTGVTAGLTYTGSWTTTDYLAYFGCLGQTSPCVRTPAQPRDYLRKYPGFVSVNLSLEQPIYGGLSGFVAVDDATNDGQRRAHSNAVPVHGRMTTVGVRARY